MIITEKKVGPLEMCVSCGKMTSVETSTPIDLREHYIEGAGQLCPGCYHRIYDDERWTP
jgi:hypothetical protein